MRAVERDALVWLPVACVSFALLLAAHALGYMVEWLARPAYTPDYLLYQALLGISMWAWVLALAGCGLRWLHVDNALLRYAGAAVLPFYIVHQAAIATVAVVVVRWNAGITAKFLVISSVAFAMTMIAYELLIRRERTPASRLRSEGRIRPTRGRTAWAACTAIQLLVSRAGYA
jgi:hypothetical protein